MFLAHLHLEGNNQHPWPTSFVGHLVRASACSNPLPIWLPNQPSPQKHQLRFPSQIPALHLLHSHQGTQTRISSITHSSFSNKFVLGKQNTQNSYHRPKAEKKSPIKIEKEGMMQQFVQFEYNFRSIRTSRRRGNCWRWSILGFQEKTCSWSSTQIGTRYCKTRGISVRYFWMIFFYDLIVRNETLGVLQKTVIKRNKATVLNFPLVRDDPDDDPPEYDPTAIRTWIYPSNLQKRSTHIHNFETTLRKFQFGDSKQKCLVWFFFSDLGLGITNIHSLVLDFMKIFS